MDLLGERSTQFLNSSNKDISRNIFPTKLRCGQRFFIKPCSDVKLKSYV